MAIYGYARISSRDQYADRQICAMRDFGVSEKNIFLDKQSGKDFDRPEYKKLLKALKPSDIIVIQSIDRLGRVYDEILTQWRIITKERQVAIVVLDMPLLDTRSHNNNLTGIFIADIVLQILSYVAQNERESIRKRQAEGIAAARERGVVFGRKQKERPPTFNIVLKEWKCQNISAREAGKRLNVSPMTFLKWTTE